MMDLVYLVITIVIFVSCILFVNACESLRGQK